MIEALRIGLKFASGCTLGEEVVVAVLDLLGGLASSAVNEVGPEGDVACNQPEVVVPTDEATVEGNACRNTPESE